MRFLCFTKSATTKNAAIDVCVRGYEFQIAHIITFITLTSMSITTPLPLVLLATDYDDESQVEQ
jgi:hypothetical protein